MLIPLFCDLFRGIESVSIFQADRERSRAVALSSFCVSYPISAQLHLAAADWFRRRKMRRRMIPPSSVLT